MKKFAIISSLIGLIGAIGSSMVASASWLNQPKTPSMFK